MKVLILALLTTQALACPDYYLLSDISAAYEDPNSEKMEKALIQVVKHFGHHKEYATRDKNPLSSTFLEVTQDGQIRHEAMARALSCVSDKLKACGEIDLSAGEDKIQHLEKWGLTVKLAKENSCARELFLKNGFYPLPEQTFAFIGEPEMPTSGCPEDMIAVPSKGSCIDRFEAPNVKGIKPFVARLAKEGIVYCKMKGKELCTDDVWQSACENEEKKTPFPYGRTYKNGTCNDDKIWRSPRWGLINRHNPNDPEANPKAREHVEGLNQVEASGAREKCRTESGIADLTGNAAEWVVNTKKKPSSETKEVYPVVMKGCYWAKCLNGINPSCAFTNSNHNGMTFRSYEAGFRCCTAWK